MTTPGPTAPSTAARNCGIDDVPPAVSRSAPSLLARRLPPLQLRQQNAGMPSFPGPNGSGRGQFARRQAAGGGSTAAAVMVELLDKGSGSARSIASIGGAEHGRPSGSRATRAAFWSRHGRQVGVSWRRAAGTDAEVPRPGSGELLLHDMQPAHDAVDLVECDVGDSWLVI